MALKSTMWWFTPSPYYSLTLPAPAPEYTVSRELFQAIGQAAGGADMVYDKNVATRTVRFTLELSLAQKAAFESFLINRLHGAREIFTWVDHQDVSHTGCRLLTIRPEFKKTASQRWTVELEVRVPGDFN